jgi:transposase
LTFIKKHSYNKRIMTMNELPERKNVAYQRNKKTGAVYAYSVRSYWDKEKKAPRNKQTYLGKVDPSTGEIIPSAKRKQRHDEVQLTDNAGAATARVAGPFYLLQKIAMDTGLAGLLKKVFPETHEQILSMVFFIVQKGLPLSRSETWSMTHLHPFASFFANQRVSDILRSLTEDAKQYFLSLWLKKMTERDYLCYDITSISSYAKANAFVRYGYNRDGENLPQVNLALLFGQNSKLPTYYRRIQGNISDVSTLKSTLKSLDYIGAKRIHFVLDRGFYSHTNIDELLERRHHFTIAVPSGRKWVEDAIDKNYESAASPSNYRDTGENEVLYVYTALYRWGEAKRRTYLHTYYNASRAGEEYDKFTGKLLKIRKQLENGSISESDCERYLRYFIIKETPKRGKSVQFNEPEIQKCRNRYVGFFCILSSHIKDAIEALHVYRRREVVENGFDDLKNQLDMKRVRVHDSQAMDSRLFLQFIGLIFICYIRNIIHKDEELKNFTVREVMELLEPIVRIKYPGRYGQVYTELGPKQKKILAAFGAAIPEP